MERVFTGRELVNTSSRLERNAALGAASTTPPSYIRVRAVVYVRPRTDTQTDTQTRVATIHFAWSTTHAKCNKNSLRNE